ncbi:DUF4270 family protein [Ancylomarina sp. 16SWW S1-10-2]|uniref:DUF4270 family protein n=1 Tax=Ancylomarina sp. 16SWW S1-10-2 TaxID=2499681 RepID=UPI00189C9C99|nr:DUF4270 family protein [Ancylomarina sp. 16SWW S1-10-2]
MKKVKYIVFSSILALLTACNSSDFEEHEIGSNLIDQSIDVVMLDTFTVESSTVKLDSVTTSGFSTFLLGKYNDPYFGNVKSDFFGQVNLASSLSSRMVNGEKVFVEFDSLVFIMYHEANKLRFVGDTLAEQTLSVHRVTEEFKLPDNKYSYKAHDELAYDDEVLGTKTFIPELTLNSVINPTDDEDPYSDRGGIRIRLDDALGLDIIEKVNSTVDSLNEILEDNVKWLNYFEGIVLKAGDNNSAIFSFQTASGMKMRLYYHDTNSSESGMPRYYDLPVSANNLNFTNHSSDFISDEYSYIQKINDIVDLEDDLSSEETDDLCFLQGGTGLMAKIRIPYIGLLNRMGLTGGILKAELVFSPEEDSYDDDLYPLPYSNFELYYTNEFNGFVSSVLNPNTNSQLSSSFIYDYRYPDESYYTFDVTSYVNNILINGQEYENALLITLPLSTIGNSVERLVIDNDRKSDTRIKLEVTYAVQNN